MLVHHGFTQLSGLVLQGGDEVINRILAGALSPDAGLNVVIEFVQPLLSLLLFVILFFQLVLHVQLLPVLVFELVLVTPVLPVDGVQLAHVPRTLLAGLLLQLLIHLNLIITNITNPQVSFSSAFNLGDPYWWRWPWKSLMTTNSLVMAWSRWKLRTLKRA